MEKTSAFSIAGTIFLDLIKSATCSPFVGIISLCTFLHLLMPLPDWHSRIWCFPQTMLNFLCNPIKPCSDNGKKEQNMGRREVELVMEKLGIFCDPKREKLQERVGSDDISALFDEELRLEEAKEAFDVFDKNCDGFIDANELEKVLCGLGFGEVSKVECQSMIRVFDDNGDGRIDLEEFLKILENCSC